MLSLKSFVSNFLYLSYYTTFERKIFKCDVLISHKLNILKKNKNHKARFALSYSYKKKSAWKKTVYKLLKRNYKIHFPVELFKTLSLSLFNKFIWQGKNEE